MRTTIDIPDKVYAGLKIAAAKRKTSVRALILEAVSRNVPENKRVRLKFPLIRGGSDGPRINLTNEQIEDILFG